MINNNLYFIINVLSSIFCLSRTIYLWCDIKNGKMVNVLVISCFAVCFIFSISYCLISLIFDFLK